MFFFSDLIVFYFASKKGWALGKVPLTEESVNKRQNWLIFVSVTDGNSRFSKKMYD